MQACNCSSQTMQYVAQFPNSKYFLRYDLPLKITTKMEILHIVATIVGHLIVKERSLYFVISFIVTKTDSLMDAQFSDSVSNIRTPGRILAFK